MHVTETNLPLQPPLEGLPASLGAPGAAGGVESLLVVGATDTQGMNVYLSSGYDDAKQLPHVYAPGDGITTPEALIVGRGNSAYKLASGTSIGK